MTITLFTNFSKEANSTKQPSGGTVVNCVLKENCSVIDPVFILDRTDYTINYVQWNNRYYFVTDLIYLRATTIELHCHVDALATYKTEIGSSSQYVTRSASTYDNTIIDRYYPMLPEPLLRNITLDSIHDSFSGSTYVIGVVAKDAVDGITFYALSNSQFASLLNALFLGNYLDAPTTEISKELQKELVNPFQYIVSAQWFPFTITGQVPQTIKFGFWDSGVSASAISHANHYKNIGQDFTMIAHSQAQSVGHFMNCAPYTQASFHCYSFGDIVLDTNAFSMGGMQGYVLISVDVFSGVGELRVYSKQFTSGSDNNVVSRATAQIGVPIQLSQVTQNLIQSAVGMASTVGAIAQGNFIGVMSGVGDAVSGLLPQVEKSGAYGTRIAFREKPNITIKHFGIVPTDREHNGSPLMQRKVINTLSGFIMVENPDVDIVGTVAEKDEIVSYMKSGFYYE